MRTRTIAIASGIALLGLFASAHARAQDSGGWSDSGASWRASDDAWYREYIAPSLKTFPYYEKNIEKQPILYQPVQPPLHPTPADRKTYRYQADGAGLRGTVMAGDLPPNRDEYVDARDWNDISETANPMRPELFRFYLEPTPTSH